MAPTDNAGSSYNPTFSECVLKQRHVRRLLDARRMNVYAIEVRFTENHLKKSTRRTAIYIPIQLLLIMWPSLSLH